MDTPYLQLPWQPADPKCLYRSRHHIPPVSAAGKAHFLWMPFYDRTSSGKSSEKWQSCKHLNPFLGYTLSFQDFFNRWEMTGPDAGFVPRKIIWTQPSKEILVNHKVVLFPSAAEQDLSCLPHACLCGCEVWSCPDPWRRSQACQECSQLSLPRHRERLPGPCAKPWATESTLCRVLVATSSIFWEILAPSFRQTKLEDKITYALNYVGYWHWSMISNKLWRRAFSNALCSLSLRNLQFLLNQWLQEKELGQKWVSHARIF